MAQRQARVLELKLREMGCQATVVAEPCSSFDTATGRSCSSCIKLAALLAQDVRHPLTSCTSPVPTPHLHATCAHSHPAVAAGQACCGAPPPTMPTACTPLSVRPADAMTAVPPSCSSGRNAVCSAPSTVGRPGYWRQRPQANPGDQGGAARRARGRGRGGRVGWGGVALVWGAVYQRSRLHCSQPSPSPPPPCTW